MRIPVAAAALLACAVPAVAGTLVVPSDGYPTIQSAVDDAGPGDVIVVAAGEYEESVDVSGKEGLAIRGKGWPVILPGPSSSGFHLGDCTGVTITGFEIDAGMYGVDAAYAGSTVLSHLRISGTLGVGIRLDHCPQTLVTKCTVGGTASHGIEDTSTPQLVIEKCTLENAGGDSIRLSAGAGENLGTNAAVVTRNRITGGSGGIRFSGENAEISKNRIEGFTDMGIEILAGTSSTGTVVTKNRVANGGGAVGIKVNVSGLTVTRNSLDGSALYFDGNDQACDRNRVSNAVWGVYAAGNNCTITGNRLQALSAFGIRSNGIFCTLEGNAVAGVDGNGIELGGANNTVTGNRVSGATQNGFDISTIGNTLTGNKAKGCGGFDLKDNAAAGQNTYEGNRFGTTSIGP